MIKQLATVVLALLLLPYLHKVALAYELERPGKYIILQQNADGAATDGKASVGLGVDVYTYHENEPGAPSNGRDYVKVQVVMKANVSKGFVQSIFARFSGIDERATVFTSESYLGRLENLRIDKIQNWGTDERETYLEATSADKAKSCFIKIAFVWIFFDANDKNHSTMVLLELLQYDEIAFRRITMPIELKVLTP